MPDDKAGLSLRILLTIGGTLFVNGAVESSGLVNPWEGGLWGGVYWCLLAHSFTIIIDLLTKIYKTSIWHF